MAVAVSTDRSIFNVMKDVVRARVYYIFNTVAQFSKRYCE